MELVTLTVYSRALLRHANELWFHVSQCCNDEKLSRYLKECNPKSSYIFTEHIKDN